MAACGMAGDQHPAVVPGHEVGERGQRHLDVGDRRLRVAGLAPVLDGGRRPSVAGECGAERAGVRAVDAGPPEPAVDEHHEGPIGTRPSVPHIRDVLGIGAVVDDSVGARGGAGQDRTVFLASSRAVPTNRRAPDFLLLARQVAIISAGRRARPRDDPGMRVRPLTPEDQRWKVETLERAWGSTLVARFEDVVDAAWLPGLVAQDGAGRVGLLTYAVRDDGIEVVTLESLVEGSGIGTALMDAVRALAIARGVPRIWLITTNDNLRAIGFYQRWGMDLVGVIHDGVTRSRLLKPSIPTVGQHGIPLRHELEFELVLSPTPRPLAAPSSGRAGPAAAGPP